MHGAEKLSDALQLPLGSFSTASPLCLMLQEWGGAPGQVCRTPPAHYQDFWTACTSYAPSRLGSAPDLGSAVGPAIHQS